PLRAPPGLKPSRLKGTREGPRAICQQVLRVVVVAETRERAVLDRPTERGVLGVPAALLAHNARNLDTVRDARPQRRARGTRPRVVTRLDLWLACRRLRCQGCRGGGRKARDRATQGS